MIFGGLALAMFLASLDQTIIATALPAIVGELGGFDQLSWIITVYHLASAATAVLWGKASDIYGRKRLLLAAVTIFLIGSVLSGLAQDIGQLIAFRACQGLGAGGMISLGMAVIADVVSPRERDSGDHVLYDGCRSIDLENRMLSAFRIIGLAIATVILFLRSTMSTDTSQLLVMLYMLLFGLGFGLVAQVLVIVVQNSAQRQDIGTATASANLALGASLGAAVFGSVFATGLNVRLASRMPDSGRDAQSVQAGPERIQLLPVDLREAITNRGHGFPVNGIPCRFPGLWTRLRDRAVPQENPLRGGTNGLRRIAGMRPTTSTNVE